MGSRARRILAARLKAAGPLPAAGGVRAGAGNPGGNTARGPQERRCSGPLPNRGNMPIFADLAGG
jgi:hypothetical protein